MYGCGCHQGHFGSGRNICPSLWSKQKKIQVLEKELNAARENVQDIENLINELKAEK